MFIANEGKKNFETKANYLEPLANCGCSPSSVKTSVKNSCVCGCKKPANSSSTSSAAK